MLERHIKVREELGRLDEDVQKILGHRSRVEIHQAHPAESLHAAQFEEKRSQTPLFIKVASPVAGVLSDDQEFLNPGARQIARFRQDFFFRTALESAAKFGDDA